MATLFKDRTDNDVKNKWYSMKRKDQRNGTTACKNPFVDSKNCPKLLTTDVDYATLNRRTSLMHALTSAALTIELSECNDDTKISTSTVDIECTSDDNVTAV